jgi:hypothetical protein
MFTTEQFILAGIVMVFLVALVFYLGRTKPKEDAPRCPVCNAPKSLNARTCHACGASL